MPRKNDLWDKLAEAETIAGIGAPETLTDGWFHRSEYAEQRGLQVASATYRLEKLVSTGLLEKRRASVRVNGKLVQTRVYRLVEKKQQLP